MLVRHSRFNDIRLDIEYEEGEAISYTIWQADELCVFESVVLSAEDMGRLIDIVKEKKKL